MLCDLRGFMLRKALGKRQAQACSEMCISRCVWNSHCLGLAGVSKGQKAIHQGTEGSKKIRQLPDRGLALVNSFVSHRKGLLHCPTPAKGRTPLIVAARFGYSEVPHVRGVSGAWMNLVHML